MLVFVLTCECVRGLLPACGALLEIAKDKDKFVKFVNGILNETNTLITEALSKLHDIRELEQAMVRVAFCALLSSSSLSSSPINSTHGRLIACLVTMISLFGLQGNAAEWAAQTEERRREREEELSESSRQVRAMFDC